MSLSRAAFVVFAVAASIVAVTGIDSDQAAPDEPVAKAEPPTQALVSLDPPPDLDAAVEAARDFTAALIGDDHAVIRRLAAGPLIDRLSDSATAAPAGRSEAQVESTLVRDARPGPGRRDRQPGSRCHGSHRCGHRRARPHP
jgi:hypothetical protein